MDQIEAIDLKIAEVGIEAGQDSIKKLRKELDQNITTIEQLRELGLRFENIRMDLIEELRSLK